MPLELRYRLQCLRDRGYALAMEQKEGFPCMKMAAFVGLGTSTLPDEQERGRKAKFSRLVFIGVPTVVDTEFQQI
eukprot:scaffold124984_cov45-Prasinocladus_malaysianus.AAC.1